MTSKCGENKKVAQKAIAECVTDVLTTLGTFSNESFQDGDGALSEVLFPLEVLQLRDVVWAPRRPQKACFHGV